MKKTLITNGFVVREGTLLPGSVLIGDGKILACGSNVPMVEDAEVIDLQGGYVLPSFIETHAHGGGGSSFIDNTRESFDTIMNTHLSHGVGLMCPTLPSSTWDKVQAFLKMVSGISSPMFAGVHLEGPFLSRAMCGAQNTSCILPPTDDQIAELCEYAPILTCITAAPEEDNVMKLAKEMVARGVAMSIGHSNCGAVTVRKAADAGFSRFTHLYCATTRRYKEGSYVVGGQEEQALIDDRFTVELIGDGHHICRESLLMTVRCKGEDRVCLVSDAMRAAGLDDGSTESFLGENKPENRVILEDGVAKLPDRSSFAGSLATGDTMVQALCGRYGLPLPMISHMLSAVPARLLGLGLKRGRIVEGYDAELTILDQNYKTKAVFIQGEKAYEVKA